MYIDIYYQESSGFWWVLSPRKATYGRWKNPWYMWKSNASPESLSSSLHNLPDARPEQRGNEKQWAVEEQCYMYDHYVVGVFPWRRRTSATIKHHFIIFTLSEPWCDIWEFLSSHISTWATGVSMDSFLALIYKTLRIITSWHSFPQHIAQRFIL